jgi:hypothetical protein
MSWPHNILFVKISPRSSSMLLVASPGLKSGLHVAVEECYQQTLFNLILTFVLIFVYVT